MFTSFYSEIVEAIPSEDIDSHESDLYVRNTRESAKLVSELASKYQVCMITTFTGRGGGSWFDIPFQYQPFWAARNR